MQQFSAAVGSRASTSTEEVFQRLEGAAFLLTTLFNLRPETSGRYHLPETRNIIIRGGALEGLGLVDDEVRRAAVRASEQVLYNRRLMIDYVGLREFFAMDDAKNKADFDHATRVTQPIVLRLRKDVLAPYRTKVI